MSFSIVPLPLQQICLSFLDEEKYHTVCGIIEIPICIPIYLMDRSTPSLVDICSYKNEYLDLIVHLCTKYSINENEKIEAYNYVTK